MKSNKKGYNAEQAWQMLFLFYAIMLPFGTALINIVFGLMIVFWSFERITKRARILPRDVVLVLIFSGYYIIGLISVLYSDNLDYAIKKALLQSYILAAPLIMITKREVFTQKLFCRMIAGFSSSLCILLLLSLINQLKKHIVHKVGFYDSFFQDDLATSVVDYYFLGLSLAVSFALISNVYIRTTGQMHNFGKVYRRLFYFINSFLLLMLLLLNSRSLIILTLFFLTWLIFKQTIREKKLKPIILFLTFSCALLVLNIQFNKMFGDKIDEAIAQETQDYPEKYWGGLGMRYLIWDCALKVFETNLIYGTGIGDQQDDLTLCYKIYMKDQLLYNKDSAKNAHNIFLQVGIATGSIGLALFVLSFLYPLAIKFKTNSIYVCFTLLFLFAGMTESFLERNVSVAFFAFFNMICFLTPGVEKNTDD